MKKELEQQEYFSPELGDEAREKGQLGLGLWGVLFEIFF